MLMMWRLFEFIKKKIYIGFKDRNIVSANFSINMITALENSIVTYMCYPNVKTRDLEQILNNFQLLVKQILTFMLEDGNYKFSTNLQATFYKSLKPNEKITASFNKGTGRALHAIFNEWDIDANIDFEIGRASC